MLNKFFSFFICFCLILEQSVFAQTIDLSHYFARNPAQTVPQSDKFRPLHLRYISYDNQANDFKLLLDKGDAVGNGRDRFLQEETQELMKYFFIGLSLPNEKFWVNLRPDSPDNILDPDLEKTDIGRIFLEADLQLKKDTSGMTSPQTKEGREYWDKLYKKAGELFPAAGGSAFGGGNITIPTITRPWIVPNEIIIREAPDNAYIYKATLKVMLEEDYLKSSQLSVVSSQQYTLNDPRLKELNEYSTRLIRETIIPKLTYAVNTAKRYAPLRQVYYSLILAQWFKQKYGPESPVSGLGSEGNSYIKLIDSGNLANLTSSQPYDKQSYFRQYQKSFQDGEYNLQESVSTPMGQSVRRYVSGGLMMGSKEVSNAISKIHANRSNVLFASSSVIRFNVKDSYVKYSASDFNQGLSAASSSVVMKDKKFLAKDVVREDGWRSLALSVRFIRELLNGDNNFDEEEYARFNDSAYFIGRVSNVFEGREIEPTRLDTYIFNGAKYAEQALVELIANAQDAMSNGKKIGRFGVGAYQMFQELKSESDSIVVTTSTDGITGLTATFKNISGELCYRIGNVVVNEKGTKIRVNTHLSKVDIKNKIGYARNKLKVNTRTIVRINGEKINLTNDYLYLNGNKVLVPREEVVVSIDENGYAVTDSGSGMSSKVFWEKFIVPKGTSKALEGKPLEDEQEIRSETRIFYSQETGDTGKCVISVSGFVIQETLISGINIPQEMVIEFPHDTWLPESRDKFELDKIGKMGLLEIAKKLTDTGRKDIINRYALLNGLVELIDNLLKEKKDDRFFYSIRELCEGLVKQETGDNKIFVPNRKEFGTIVMPSGKEIVFLDEKLYSFNPADIGAEKVNSFSGRNKDVYLADMDISADNDIYIEGDCPYGRGWIIFDKNTWEANKDQPWLIEWLFNFNIGYGDPGRAFGELEQKVEEIGIMQGSESSNDASGIIKDFFDAGMNSILENLGPKDKDWIEVKLREEVQSGTINSKNIIDLKNKFVGFFKWILEFKANAPGITDDGWLGELFGSEFVVRKCNFPGIKRAKDATYAWYKGANGIQYFEVGKNGVIKDIDGDVLFRDDNVYIVKPSGPGMKELYLRKDGKNILISKDIICVGKNQGDVSVNTGEDPQEKEIITVKRGEKNNLILEIINGEDLKRFCQVDDNEFVDNFDGNEVNMYTIKRGNCLFFSTRRILEKDDIYLVDMSGRVNKLSIPLFNLFGYYDVIALSGNKFISKGIGPSLSFLQKGLWGAQYRVVVFTDNGEFIFEDVWHSPKAMDKDKLRVWEHDKQIYYTRTNKLMRIYNNVAREVFSAEYDETIVDLQFVPNRIASIILKDEGHKYRIVDYRMGDYDFNDMTNDKTYQDLSKAVIIANNLYYIPNTSYYNTKYSASSSVSLYKISPTGKVTLVLSNVYSDIYSDGEYIYCVQIATNEDKDNKIIRVDKDGKQEIIYTIRGNMGFNFEGDEVIFSEIGTDNRYIYDLKNGKVRGFRGSLSERHGVHIKHNGLFLNPSISFFLAREVFMSKNMTIFANYLPKIKFFLYQLNEAERRNLFSSFVGQKDWSPAYIFIPPEHIVDNTYLEGSREFLEKIVFEAQNIDDIRKIFRRINYIFDAVPDEQMASRIVERLAKIYSKNKELSEIVMNKVLEPFISDVSQDTPLKMYVKSEDMSKLPFDIQIYLKFLTADEISPPSVIEPDEFSGIREEGEVYSVDFSVLLRLRELFPDKINRPECRWEDVLSYLPKINAGYLSEIKRTIAGAVNGQDRMNLYYIRELSQNARDAIREVMGIKLRSGFIGHGFYTVFAGGADEVRLRTGRNKEVYELILKPYYDVEGNLLRIEVKSMRKFRSDFKGTLIQRVEYCTNQADPDVIIDSLYAASQIKRFLGAIPSRGEQGVTIILKNNPVDTGEVINEDGYSHMDRNRVIEVSNGISGKPNRDGYFERTVSMFDPVGMDLFTVLNKLLPPDISGKPAQAALPIENVARNMASGFSPEGNLRVTVDNLYVDNIGYDYTELIPSAVLDILLANGWNVNFPPGTPVSRTRIGVKNLKEYRPWIAVLAFKTLIQMYLSEGKIEIHGLPKDYIYSNSNAIIVSQEVEEDAARINNEYPGEVDFLKYRNNIHLLVQLLTRIKVELNGSTTSLAEIKERVLEEYHKEKSEDVDIREILPKGIESIGHIAESYIKGYVGSKKLNIDDLLKEPILRIFKEFFDRLNKIINLNNKCLFEAALGGNNRASALGERIYWNLAYHKDHVGPMLEFLANGKINKNFTEFIQTYIHESAHTLEEEMFAKHKNLWSHQAEQDLEGAFGWIMKKLIMRLLKSKESINDIRMDIIKEMEAGGESFDKLRESYSRLKEFIKINNEELEQEDNQEESESSSSLVHKNKFDNTSYPVNKGGIAFNALPIQTESVASSALGALPGARAFQGDLDAEWAQIQSVFNAGVRPSIQRISEYTAAAAASPLAEDKIDQVRGMLADILRRDEESERLTPAEESCKQLLRVLELR